MRSEHHDVRLPEHKPNIPEDRVELGHTLMLCGWLCWMFVVLVLVFRSAEVRAGGTAMFNTAVSLGIVGLILQVIGRVMNRRR